VEQPSTILIVDDDHPTRTALEGLLSQGGYRLGLATSGREALDMATTLRPDLILLDVMMPGMDGFAVCRGLRADPVLAEVPVIMITALDDRDSRVEGIAAGADDFLSKPIDFVELEARVRTITRLNRYRRLLNERAQREQAEMEAAVAQETARLKDLFISNVSHELRTPLAVLTLLSGNLEALYGRLDDTKRRGMVRQIRDQVAVLNQLVGSVLEISRADGRRMNTAHGLVDLAKLAQAEVASLLPIAQSQQQTVEVFGSTYLPVRGAAEELRRVVSNLLSNAMKYSQNGTRILLECAIAARGDVDRAVWPGSDELSDGRWAALRVKDTGIGIDAESLPRVFERFYRASPQGTIPGVGLGLAIALEIAKAHGGIITVESTPGVGSTFALYMPLAEEGTP
jgi:signal transduction histidine kinase